MSAPRVPDPIVVGDIVAQVMPSRGLGKVNKPYWRARKGGAQEYVWTGRGDPHEVLCILAGIATGSTPPVKRRDSGEPAMDTTAQALDVWWSTTVGPSDLAPATKAHYRTHVRSLSATIGHVALGQLAPRHADAHRQARRKADIGDRAIHGELWVLSKAWGWWKDIGRIQADPPKVVVKITDKRTRRTPTQGELRTVIDSAEGWIKALLALMEATGARRGEITHLRPEDIDLEAGWIHVGRHEGACKTGPRSVPVRGESLEALRTLLANPIHRKPTRKAKEYTGPELFGNPASTRTMLDRWLAQWPWDKHKIKPFTTHGIRRMVADKLVRAKVDLTAAAALLGHSMRMMLEIYRQVTEEDVLLASQQAGLGLPVADNNVVPFRQAQNSGTN